jgi:hypothetical protein
MELDARDFRDARNVAIYSNHEILDK